MLTPEMLDYPDEMTDCISVLQDVRNHTEALVSACLQAEATIHAARIQASAARQAGTMGLIAGLVAGVGALLAAGVAYWSVGEQVRVVRDQERARVQAYRHYLVIMVEISSNDAVQFQRMWHKKSVVGWDLIHGILENYTLKKLWSELNPENWYQHFF